MLIQVIIVAVISATAMAADTELSPKVDIHYNGREVKAGYDSVFFKTVKEDFLIMCRAEEKTGLMFELLKWGSTKFDVDEIVNSNKTALFKVTPRAMDKGNLKAQFVCNLMTTTDDDGFNSTTADVYFMEPDQKIHIQSVKNGQATTIPNPNHILLEIGDQKKYILEFLKDPSSLYTKLDLTYELNQDHTLDVKFKIQYESLPNGVRLTIEHHDRLSEVFLTYICTLYTPSGIKDGRVQVTEVDGPINFVVPNSSSVVELSLVLMMILVMVSIASAM